jgi:hypothetical protein
MARFPRTITLIEACGRILRAKNPDQPALADKITRYGWELSYLKDDITLSKRQMRLFWSLSKRQRMSFRREEETARKEMAKFKEARELFGGLVAREKIRLRGTLEPRDPLDDVDPADAEDGKLDILTGELRVFRNGKLVKTYRQVRCYEADVDCCAAELRSETKRNGILLPKQASETDADPPEKRQRSARKSELVKKAIAGLFPKGVPKTLPNPELVQQIMNSLADYCKENGIAKPAISPSTVLRAAGRKDKDT